MTPNNWRDSSRNSDIPWIQILFQRGGTIGLTPENGALVACGPDGSALGVATLHRMMVLHRPHPVGRITSLIVDATARGQGIGRALVTAAEKTLADDGCALLEITSNFRLIDAHAFYEHLGYNKTSVRLAKEVGVQAQHHDSETSGLIN